MTDEIQNLFFSLGNFSNFYAILVTIFCFIAMVVFILRLNEDTFLRNFRAIKRCEEKPESPVYNVQNPFSVRLSSDHKHLDISLQKASMLYIYWGTVITELFSEVQKPWIEILEALKTGIWLNDFTLTIEKGIRLDPGKHLHSFIRPADVTGEKLGSRPRSRYPAIVISVVENTADIMSRSDSQIVAMFSVIHVQDTVCNSESHIMYQYLKTSDDCVTTLQPLFVSTPNDSSQTGDIASSGDNSSNRDQVKLNNASVNADQFDHQLISENINAEKDSAEMKITRTCNGNETTEELPTECVVCQNNAVTIAILPCRHTCVCDNCLEQLDKCPMCRGYIFSYFRISRRNSSQHSSRRSSSEVLADTTNESRWESMNRRLNELLGFQ